MDFGFWHVTCAILVPGVLWASWIDYAQRRVPNWLNLSLLIAGFATQGYFFGGAADPMRRILIERARRKHRLRHDRDFRRVATMKSA